MEFDAIAGKMLFNATAWAGENRWQRLYAAFVALSAAFAAVAGVAVFGMFFAAGSFVMPDVSPTTLVGLGAAAFAVLLVFALAGTYLYLKMLRHALRFEGYSPAEAEVEAVPGFIALGILAALQTVFCWKEKTFLAFGVISCASMATGAFIAARGGGAAVLGYIVLLLGALALLPYFFGVAKHSVKLSLAPFYFVMGRGISESLQKSWDATAGWGWRILGASVAFYFVVGTIQSVFNQLAQYAAVVPEVGWVIALCIWALPGPAWQFATAYGTAGLYAIVDGRKTGR